MYVCMYVCIKTNIPNTVLKTASFCTNVIIINAAYALLNKYLKKRNFFHLPNCLICLSL